MDKHQILEIISVCIQSLILPLLLIGIQRLSEYLRGVTRSRRQAEAVTVAENVIQKVVASVAQSYVIDLKKSGDFNKEAQSKAFNRAVAECRRTLSEEVKRLLRENYGNLEQFLTHSIEAEVLRQK